MKIYIPAFPGSAIKVRHGGVRRSDQIRLSCVFDEEFQYRPWKQTLKAAPVRVLMEFLLDFSLRMTFRGNVSRAVYVTDLKLFLKKKSAALPNSRFFIETAPGAPFFLADYLSRRKADFAVCAHNIEFLVPSQNRGEFLGEHAAMAELNFYRQARKAVGISPMDVFVLSSLCPDAIDYPYFPVRDLRDRFEAIRAARAEGRPDNSYLCLGTVSNIPTEAGVRRIIESFGGIADAPELLVAGFGTEKFKSCENDRIRVLGSVTESDLDRMLTQARAVVLYQPPTSGFLTKLVEFNLCGIPVYINRSYMPARGLEEFGIHQYDDVSEVLAQPVRERGQKLFTPPSPLEIW